MKFSQSSIGNSRLQMRERQRRDRTAAPEMRIRYPQFAELRFEFGFRDRGPFPPTPQVTVMHPAARAYFLFPCPLWDCSGEFDLGTAIQDMAKQAGGMSEGQLRCSGHRRIDSNTQSPCALVLEYRIEAVGQPLTPGAPAG